MISVGVIGAGGFVGQSLVESCVLDSDVSVRAIIRNYRNLAGLCRFGSLVDVRRADAEDVPSLKEAVAGMHTVVNVTTGPPAGIGRSTKAIVVACRDAGVRRLVHLSSAVVYGDVLNPVGDDDPPVSRHWMPYARAKAAAELWLRERSTDEGLDIVVLRPGIVWGVRSPHTFDIARALGDKSAYLVGDGAGIFNGVFIANLTASIRACCQHPGRVSGFYNVGDCESVTWRDFFDALGPALDCDTRRLPVVDGGHFPRSVRSTIDSIQSLPMVNETYHRLKVHVSDGLKTSIRARLEGRYRYERNAAAYATSASVDREMWHLQRTRHKLPTAKFARTFGFVPPVSFPEGIRRTVSWLDSLGLVSRTHEASRD
jgi:nucleoside-diphosphate-sugar epimerase